MKRHGYLWSQIIDFENLLCAAQKAQKGKRFRENVLRFNFDLEHNLLQLQAELQNQVYFPGNYTTFEIYEPKRRMISAAPYRDRIVHHALCNIINPIFERTLTGSCYANRIGYGSHRALKKFVHLARSHQYILQCDIQKYFPSIDHQILKSLIRRKIKCPNTLSLIDLIIDASNPQYPVHEYFPSDDLFTPWQRRRGLPLGNLTSQFFANIYLSSVDHFVLESLRISEYIRYVDDFVLFSDSRQALEGARQAIEQKLSTIRLKIHPIKSQLFETKHGANFLGFRVLPNQIRVRSENLKRGRKRLRALQLGHASQTISTRVFQERLQSWFAHLNHADSWTLQQQILNSYSLPYF